MVLVTNTNLAGNGIVTGGTMRFELTLRGDSWLQELKRLGVLQGNRITTDLPVFLQLGKAHHSTTVKLEQSAVSEYQLSLLEKRQGICEPRPDCFHKDAVTS